MSTIKITPLNIRTPKPNQILVYASDVGASADPTPERRYYRDLAVSKFGACPQYIEGRSGQAYAIPAIDSQLVVESRGANTALRMRPLILLAIETFRDYARRHPRHQFLFTALGFDYVSPFPVGELSRYVDPKMFIGTNITIPREYADAFFSIPKLKVHRV